MAGCHRDDRSRSEVVDTFAWWRRNHWGFHCLSSRRIGSYSSCSSLSYAIRRHWICLSGFADAGRFPLQDVQRSPATCQEREYHFAALGCNRRRRHDRLHDHSGDEFWTHCSQDRHRSPPLEPQHLQKRRRPNHCPAAPAMSEVQQAKLPSTGAPPSILLGMTAVTGIVDAVSFLALGHDFTANMTGNIVFLGFAVGGAAGLLDSGCVMLL